MAKTRVTTSSGKPAAGAAAATLKPAAPKVEVMPKALYVLSKEQFSNTDLPGAKIIRAEDKVITPRYSIATLVGMGLLGAGAGYGVSRATHGKGSIYSILGGAAGVAAGALINKMRVAEGKTDVVGVVTDGKSSILTVSPSVAAVMASRAKASRPRGRRKPPKRFGVMPVLLTNKETEFPGWAGAIIAHGALIQHTMYARVARSPVYDLDGEYWNKCIQSGPDYMMAWDKGSDCVHEFYRGHQKRVLIWSRPEWPAPGFTMRRLREDTESFYTGTAYPQTVPFHISTCTNEDHRGAQRLFYSMNDIGPNRSPQLAIRQLIERCLSRGLPFAKQFGMDKAYATYHSAGAWQWVGNRSPYILPEWQNKGEDVTRIFWNRYSRMMQRAQWFVWAAEMFRMHAHNSPYSTEVPSWWRNHCLAWGVGCATPERIHDIPRMSTVSEEVDGETVYPWRVDVSHDYLKLYLELVIENTPDPFTTPRDRQLTIVPDRIERFLLDFPDNFLDRTIIPPIELYPYDNVRATLLSRFAGSAQMPGWAQALVGGIILIASIVIGIFTEGAGTVAGTAILAILAAVWNLAVMLTNGEVDASSMVNTIGKVLSAVCSAASINLSDFGGLGDFLDEATSWANNMNIGGYLDTIKGWVDVLEGEANYPFMDELLGTTLDGDALLSEGVQIVTGV